jgi:hypothetical protein
MLRQSARAMYGPAPVLTVGPTRTMVCRHRTDERSDMPVNPSNPEDEYFIREEAEKLKKLAEERKQRVAAEEREAQQKLHYMRCPKCGDELHTLRYGQIELDRCFACHGTWLDEGELEKIAAHDEHEHSFSKKITRLFRR